MKTMRILSPILLLLLFTPLVHAQITYYFANPTLVSGTALKLNAVYRFTKVKTGTDALVQITNLTGGMTLGTPLDQTTTGYDSAFQPTIVVPALSNGYVEFKITFVATGTSTPQVQTNIAATALDIDGLIVGTDSLFEFDMVDMGTGSAVDYDTKGGQLTITKSGTAYTGQTHTATNYPGIATTATAVMYTVISSGMSSMTYRTGVINNINEVPPSRVASLYFGPITYPNSFITLPVSPLQSFTGSMDNPVVNLEWQMIPDAGVDTVWVERSTDGRHFQSLCTLDSWKSGGDEGFGFRDDSAAMIQSIQGMLFYRLKLHQKAGMTSLSYVVSIKAIGNEAEVFSIYPNMIKSDAVLHLSMEKAGQATFLLLDTRGQVVQQRTLSLVKGSQSQDIDGLGRLAPGMYMAVLKTEKATFRQKLMKVQ